MKSQKLVSILLAPALVVGGVSAASIVAVTPAYAADATTTAQVTQQIFDQINTYRVAQGLAPLQRNAAMDKVAQDWSQQQYERGVMPGHNPNYSTEIPGGATLAGENVAYGQTPGTVVNSWLSSNEHRSAIENNFTSTGIGYYEVDGQRYYTQVFANYPSVKTITSRPAAPTVGLDAQNQLTANWTAPKQTGNASVTSYDVTATPTDGADPVTARVTGNTHTFTNLLRGKTYNVTVRANNSAGSSQYSTATSGSLPAGAPDAPIVNSLTPTADSATFGIAGYNGGAAITSTTVRISGRPDLVVPAGSPVTVSGLQPGTRYAGSVVVNNSVGASPATSFAFETAKTVASAPQNVAATLTGERSVQATWVAPATNGGAAVSGYTVSISDSNGAVVKSVDVASTVLKADFADLAKNASYTVTVTANNSVGASTAATAAVAVPATVPSVATGVKAELVDEQQIAVEWKAPSDNGGNPINGYTVYFYANGSTDYDFRKNVSADTLNTVLTEADGVLADTTYTVRVVATSDTGASKTSSASNAVVVPKTPTAPTEATNVKTVADATSVVVTYGEPTSNGGAAITGYFVSIFAADGSFIAGKNTTDPETVTFNNLTRGTDYSVLVEVANKKGNSSANKDFTTLLEAPSAPVNVNAKLNGYDAINSTWTVPADNGGGKLAYSANLYADGKLVKTVPTSSTNVTFEDLAPGTVYTVTVVADNGQRKSVASTSSNAVTTPDVPSAPTDTQVAEASGVALRINWTPSESDVPVDSYIVKAYDAQTGELVDTQEVYDATSTVTGLKPVTSYRVTVTAVSAIGSSETASVTGATTPDRPEAVNSKATVQADNSVIVSWDYPVDNGDAVTGYVVTQFDANFKNYKTYNVSGADLNYTVTGLDPNTSYYFSVSANNNYGNGITGPTSLVKTNILAPSAPVNIEGTNPADKTVRVSWTAPTNNGGEAPSSYLVSLYNAENDIFITSTTVSGTDASFTRLAAGKPYYATVSATNSAGTGVTAISNTINVAALKADAVTNLTATVQDDKTVKLNWTAAVDNGSTINGYLVDVRSEDGQTSVSYQNVTGTEATVTDLAPGTTYRVVVWTNSSLGLSANSINVTTKKVAPSAPESIVLVNSADRAANITWKAPKSNGGDTITSYNVELRDSTTDAVVANKKVATVEEVVFTVAPGKSYYATVTATNSIGTSGVAKSPVTQVEAVRTDAVGNYTAVLQDDNSVVLNWTAPADNGGAPLNPYAVLLNDGVTGELITSAETEGLTYTFSDLDPNRAYNFSVIASTEKGNNSSPVIELKTKTVVASAPQNVKVTRDETTLVTTFKAPTTNGGEELSGYAVNLYNASTKVLVSTKSVKDGPVEFANVDRGTSYYVTVSAVNSAGSSPAAGSSIVEVPAIAPSAVKTVTAKLDGSTAIAASWSAPYNGGSAITGYDVALYKSGTDAAIRTIKVDANTSTASFTELDPATSYTVAVTVRNAVGNSDATRSDSVTTKVIPADAPADVVAELGKDETSVDATWSAPVKNGGEDVKSYTVNLLDANGKVVSSKEVTTTEVSFAGLTYGATYQVSVIANNSAGASKATVSASVKVPAVAPDAPTNVALATVSTNSARVSWKAPVNNGGAEIASYTVVLTSEDGKTIQKVVEGNTTETTFDNLAGDTRYIASVFANNGSGVSGATVAPQTIVTAPDAAPVAPEEEALDAENLSGTVEQDGTTLIVTLEGVAAGEWVYGYAYSEPVSLGSWVQVDENGVARFSFANAGLAAGEHRLAVLNSDGELVTVGEFDVAAVVIPTDPTDPNTPVIPSTPVVPVNPVTPVVEPANNGNYDDSTLEDDPRSAAKREEERKLAFTGTEGLGGVGSAALALLLAGMGLVGFNRRRRNGIESD